MRLIIYDNNPGSGISNWFLRLVWMLYAHVQKAIGNCDVVIGANSWREALEQVGKFTYIRSLQYWGHGSDGTAWLAGEWLSVERLIPLAKNFAPDAYVWFRTCYTFNKPVGRLFALRLAEVLDCTVAGHTKVIGLLQPGFQRLEPGEIPDWADETGSTLWCFQVNLPSKQ